MVRCTDGIIGADSTSLLVNFRPYSLHFPAMSFSKFATVEDFQRWEDHAKLLDCYTLKYIIKDCQSAEKCMRGFDPIREGYYSDQAATYGMELTRRNQLLPARLRHRV